MTRKRMTAPLGTAVLVLVTIAAVAAALWSSPPKDTLVVTPGTTLALGVSPTSPGNSGEWFYAYCVESGGSISDTIPVQVQVNNTNSTSGQNYTVHFSASGPLKNDGYLTLPSDFSRTDDGTSTTVDIGISTGALTSTTTGLVQVDTTANPDLTNAPVNIHIMITVGSTCASDPNTGCFLTDSEFNLLNDCSGNPVSTNTGGTFQIVANGKSIVSTNPGQFYYNLIWANTSGSDQTVTFSGALTNLLPTGANSVHAFVFDSSGFTEDLSNFDMVNQDGTPCGPYGPCTITVPSGQILWVTWHLYYSYIGHSTAGLGLSNSCSTTCLNTYKGYIAAAGTLKDQQNNTLTTCTSSACGYLKH